MVFIDPIKHASTFKRFSKHDNVIMSSDNRFCLQKRKKQVEGNHNNYRIILLGNPYYVIAYSNDLNSLKEREWRYLTEEIPRRIPDNKAEKELVPWFLAHFTCLAMELGEKYQPDPDSDDEGQPTTATSHPNLATPSANQSSSFAPPTPRVGASMHAPGAPLMHTEPISLDRPYFSKTAPAGQVGAGFVPPPQSRHSNNDNKLYPSSTFPLRGITGIKR